MGYYDPHPLIELSRPVALIGFVGADVNPTGHLLSRMTGAPLFDLDRVIEHRSGRSLVQFLVERGSSALRSLEHVELMRGLEQQPPPLMLLGEGAWQDSRSFKSCLEACTTIYIRRPRDVLFKRSRQCVVEAPSRYPVFARHFPQNDAEFVALLSRREPRYERATYLLDAGTLSTIKIARRVMALLGW